MFDRTSLRSSMHAFVCLHARVREGVRPSVRVHVRASKCLIVQACVHQCMRSCVCMHACVRASVRLSACMFVRPNDCSHMRAFINACAAFLTSNFHVCTWVFASVRICAHVYPSVRMCVRVSMLAFVFVHARVRARGRMCESIRPPVPLPVCLSARVHVRAPKCLIVHACVHQCMRSCVCMHACVRAYVWVRPSIRLSVRVHVRASKCLFAHAEKNRKDDRVKKTVQELKTG